MKYHPLAHAKSLNYRYLSISYFEPVVIRELEELGNILDWVFANPRFEDVSWIGDDPFKLLDSLDDFTVVAAFVIRLVQRWFHLMAIQVRVLTTALLLVWIGCLLRAF